MFWHLKRNQKDHVFIYMFSSYFNFPPQNRTPKNSSRKLIPAPSLNHHTTQPQESTLPGLPGHMELVLRPPWSRAEEITSLGWWVTTWPATKRLIWWPATITNQKGPRLNHLVRGCYQINSHWVVDMIQDALPGVFGGSTLVLVHFFVPHTFNKSAFCRGSKTMQNQHDFAWHADWSWGTPKTIAYGIIMNNLHRTAWVWSQK